MNRLIGLTPYALVGFTLLYGLIDVIKDWENYRRSGLKIGAIAVLALIAIFTVVSLRMDVHTEQQRDAEMKELEGKAEASTTAQANNTAIFLQSFKDLSKQVADLQTQVETDALQKKLASVQTALQATEKALAPAPKAELQFTFDPPTAGKDGKPSPVTEITLPVDRNGNMHVSFDIMNPTDVAAIDGEIILAICDSCKFAKEPAQSRKLTNEPDTQRDFSFERILANTMVGEAADITVPSDAPDVQMGMSYRCRNCVVPTGFSSVLIHQRRETSP